MNFTSIKSYKYFAWGLAGLFFMMHYIIRVAPQEMIDLLRGDFDLNMSDITAIQSAFFISYIFMQVPAGLLIDRYPPHRILQGAVATVLLSSFIFSQAPSFAWLIISRSLLGIGSAFAFSGSVKMATLWFPRQYLGILTSLTQVLGMVGAASQSMIDDTLNVIPWRSAVEYYTLALLVMWFLMLVIWQEHPDAKQIQHTRSGSFRQVLADFKEAMLNKQTWLVSLYTGFIFAPTLVFGESIGLKYLDVANEAVTVHQGTILITILFIGFSIGGILQGVFSDYIGKRRPSLSISALGSLVCFSLFLYAELGYYELCVLIFFYGLFDAGLVIGYALAGEINPRRISGAGIAFANMMSVLVGTVILRVSGFALENLQVNWGYDEAVAYQLTFMFLPVCILIALYLVQFIQESFCRSVDESL